MDAWAEWSSKSRPGIPLLLNLSDGKIPEPPVENYDFLVSYFRFGAGLRVITAHQQYKVLTDTAASPLAKFAASTTLYQTLGMLFEDIVSTLVAWSVWARDRSLRLADLYKRTVLVTNSEASRGNTYHHECVDQFLASTKAVRVSGQQFIASLTSSSDEAILQFIGIPWERVPSTKAVPRAHRPGWDALPRLVKEMMLPLGSKGATMITASYNKLKHGPQMIISNPVTTLIEKRGYQRSEVARYRGVDQPHIRVLFDGSRTQELSGELDSGKRVASFLVHQPEPVEKVMIQMGSTANLMLALSWWQIGCVFRTFVPVDIDPALHAVAKDFMQRLNRRRVPGL